MNSTPSQRLDRAAADAFSAQPELPEQRQPTYRQACIGIALLSIIALQSCTDMFEIAARWIGFEPAHATDEDVIKDAHSSEEPSQRRTWLRELHVRSLSFLEAAQDVAENDDNEENRRTAKLLLKRHARAASEAAKAVGQ